MDSLKIPQCFEPNNCQATEGRRIMYGPSPLYLGPRPPISCEIYITNLPMNLDDTYFFQWLNRCGAVYEMRLMMNPEKNETRGYGFVRFFEQKAAARASELMSFLFLNGKRPSAQPSQCKRQLYVGNIPKSLSSVDVQREFQKLFPGMTSCKAYPAIVNGLNNKGFAFLDFVEHDNALEAKRYLKSTRVWNQHIKADWARPSEQESEENSQKMEVFGPLKKNDYCAKLRLYCLANNYCIPVVVYGSNFRQYEVQYVGVLLKNPLNENYCCIIVESVGITHVFDIHLLICEVATHLIECVRGLPTKNYVVRVRNGTTAKILFSFDEIEQLYELTSKQLVFINGTSVYELFASLELLALYQPGTILKKYKQSFRSEIAETEHVARMCLIEGCPRSYFYSIYPKFRDNYALNNNFNDTEIVLLLATATSDNMMHIPMGLFENVVSSRSPDEGAFVLKSQRYNCHPHYKLEYVDLAQLVSCGFYHPLQRVNTPPLWVSGETYQENIFQRF